MAGSQSHLVMPICDGNDVHQNAITTATGDQWAVQYSRYFNAPCPDPSAPLHHSITITRRIGWKGTWLSTSSSDASLGLTPDHSRSDSVLSVTLRQKVLEEHYISKLQFTWPQVSCLSGYPPRGCRVIFVSYKDQLGKIQKFALRFMTTYESESFAKFLKESLENYTANVLPCGNPRSDLTSQSEFIPSDELDYRPRQDWSPMTSVNSEQKMAPTPSLKRPRQDWSPMTSGNSVQKMAPTPSLNHEEHLEDVTATVLPYSDPKSDLSSQSEFIPSDELIYRPQLDWSPVTSSGTSVQKKGPSSNHDVSQNSSSQEIASVQNVGANASAFPPSFTSLLMTCCPVPEQGAAKPTASHEVADLKTEITKYLEDSSFQDMLSKVQRVINEIGDDLLL